MKHLHLFGGNGYIGKNIQMFFEDDPDVIVTTQDSPAREIPDVACGNRYMLHLASPRKTLPKTAEVNALMRHTGIFGHRFKNALEDGDVECRELNIPTRQVLYFSSQSVWDSPLSLYGHYKWCGEHFARKRGYKVVNLGTVFGFVRGGPIRGDTAINKILIRKDRREEVHVTRAARCWTPMDEVLLFVVQFINGAVLEYPWMYRARLSDLFEYERIIDETGCSLRYHIPYAAPDRIRLLRDRISLYFERMKKQNPEVV